MSFLPNSLPKTKTGHTNPSKRFCYQTESAIRLIGFLVLLGAFILFGLRAKTGLHLIEFVDETEKFVAVQMLNQGQHLYKDIFAHHGPILYMFAHIYTKLVSQSDFSLIRLMVIFLAISAGMSVALSPIFNSITAKTWAFAVYLIMLSSVWLLQGLHMLLYQQIGGFLFVVVFSQMVLPALLGKKLNKTGLFWSGFSIMTACFCAYSFGPTGVLLVFSTFLSLHARQENLGWDSKAFLSGLFIAVIIVMLWLLRYGDVLGYLIYHFYFNQVVYAPFIEFNSSALFSNFTVSLAPDKIIKSFSVTLLYIWFCILMFIMFNKTQSNQSIWLKGSALLCLFIAVFLINPRGETGFQNDGFLVFNFAAISLVLAFLLENSKTSWIGILPPLAGMLFIMLLTEQLRKCALSSPGGVKLKELSSFVVALKPEQSDIYNLVRAITPKEGKILSLPFNPQIYIKANRLPASGHYYYLPWQAAYNHVSVLGYNIDLCKDIVTNKPSVIWFDNWRVWGKYSIEQYEPCVFNLIKKNYVRIYNDSAFHVRNELLLNFNP